MKYFLLAASLALASCATQRTLTPARPPADATSGGRDEGPAYTPATLTKRPDGSSKYLSGLTSPVDKPSGRRLFGLLPPKASPHTQAGGVPRKCKGCTFNTVAGDQHNSTTGKKGNSATGDGTTATSIGKNNGPTAVGDSASATDNTKQGQRGGAGASGAGAKAEATTIKPGLPWGRIAAGVVVGGFLIWVLFGGGAATLLAFGRRKSSTHNQA
jgi:hypothetical protein